ncbi:MAG: secretin N-terminal domain-containing protein, partial [Planctomycetota bacterium]
SGAASSNATTSPSDTLAIPGASSATQAEQRPQRKDTPPIIVAPGPGGVMIACEDPEVLAEFKELLMMLADSSLAGESDITVFYLKFAKAATAAQVLESVFSGGTTSSSSGGSMLGDIAGAAFGDSGGVLGSLLGFGSSGTGSITPTGALKITPDPRLNALVVQGNPTDTARVEELLKIIDQKDSPEEVLARPKVKMVPVYNAPAEEIMQVVQEVYRDRQGGSQQQQQGQQGGGPSPQQFLEMLRSRSSGGRGGPPSRGGFPQRGGNQIQEEIQRMTLSVDARTNSIVVAAPEPLLSEVVAVIEDLDHAALTNNNETMHVITLERTSPETVRDAIEAIMGGNVQSSRSSSSRPSSSSSRSSSRSGYPSGYGGSSRGGYPSAYGGSSRGGYPSAYGGSSRGGYPSAYGGSSRGGYPSGYGTQSRGSSSIRSSVPSRSYQTPTRSPSSSSSRSSGRTSSSRRTPTSTRSSSRGSSR